MISIIRVSPIEHFYLTDRQERLLQVKQDLTPPPKVLSVERTLHQHGFDFKDLTNVERINLFI